ncbi:uncharacterized protein LOC136076634 isoform X2 [Hydra vulgaris]|uniref:Uncharacterized protein LOC136076634 isoform X2 n=1 Tax=Hydra vulgaris TaxID=6087 RepID=A0ABM4BAQ7_HYDVU
MEVIKSNILRTLPHIDGCVLNQVVKNLWEIGVENETDLYLVKVDDLVLLKPIQQRKLLESWAKESSDFIVATQSSIQMVPTVKVKNNSTNSIMKIKHVSAADWYLTFVLPWAKMSREVQDILAAGERPLTAHRCAIIRIIMNDVLAVCPKPLKKHLDVIASSMVAKYPKSFKDEYGTTVIGSGHDSLTLQLVNRYDYLQRPNRVPPLMSVLNMESQKEQLSVDVIKRKTDSYGCLNREPVLSVSNSPEELKYYLQRTEINEKMLLNDLLIKFPNLFTVDGLLHHFDVLMGGVNAGELLMKALYDEKLYLFLHSCGIANLNVKKVIKNLDKAKHETLSDLPVAPGLLMALISLFNEKLDALFMFVDETMDQTELVPRSNSPHLCVYGNSLFTANRFMLVIDCIVAVDGMNNFIKSFCCLFASFYIFNIPYPKEASSILEFCQRAFFGINPEKGSKARRTKKTTAISKAVLSILQKFAKFNNI